MEPPVATAAMRQAWRGRASTMGMMRMSGARGKTELSAMERTPSQSRARDEAERLMIRS
jgi:hypothetical protein